MQKKANHGIDFDFKKSKGSIGKMKKKKNGHYFEAHVTVEPISDLVVFEAFQAICDQYEFRIAKLLMRRPDGTLENSDIDSFTSARSDDFIELERRMHAFLTKLQVTGFDIRRYKIESTILDSRHDDSFFSMVKELKEHAEQG